MGQRNEREGEVDRGVSLTCMPSQMQSLQDSDYADDPERAGVSRDINDQVGLDGSDGWGET